MAPLKPRGVQEYTPDEQRELEAKVRNQLVLQLTRACSISVREVLKYLEGEITDEGLEVTSLRIVYEAVSMQCMLCW